MHHKEKEFYQMRDSIPCCYRGEPEIKKVESPATPCCQSSVHVKEIKFYCSLYKKWLNNTTPCWICKDRKENNC